MAVDNCKLIIIIYFFDTQWLKCNEIKYKLFHCTKFYFYQTLSLTNKHNFYATSYYVTGLKPVLLRSDICNIRTATNYIN